MTTNDQLIIGILGDFDKYCIRIDLNYVLFN